MACNDKHKTAPSETRPILEPEISVLEKLDDTTWFTSMMIAQNRWSGPTHIGYDHSLGLYLTIGKRVIWSSLNGREF